MLGFMYQYRNWCGLSRFNEVTNMLIRNIDSMGNGLLYINIYNNKKKLGLKYHLLYNNDYKPPLDISFDIDIGHTGNENYILNSSWIRLYSEENNYLNEINECFQGYLIYENLWILKEYRINMFFLEYEVDENTSLLFDDMDFVGLVIKNISHKELIEIKKSGCL